MKRVILGLVCAGALVAAAYGQNRTNTTQKGSLLIFPLIDVRFDSNYNVIGDTFIQLTNDWPDDPVHIVTYFVLEEQCIHLKSNFDLTANQPAYWSMATGKTLSPVGSGNFVQVHQPVTSISCAQNGQKNGFLIVFATNSGEQNIRHNHLTGLATIVDYEKATAWEYAPYAFQVRGFGNNNGPADPANVDPTPGVMTLDGVEYDSGLNQLLLEFIAWDSTAFQGETSYTLIHDTELTLMINDVNVKQDKGEEWPYETKAVFAIHNQLENSAAFEYCFTCWSSIELSDLGVLFGPNLGTARGRAQIDGVASPDVCDTPPVPPISSARALLGTAVKILTFTAGSTRVSETLAGKGSQTAVIKYDAGSPGSEEAGWINGGAMQTGSSGKVTPAGIQKR